MRAVSLLLAIGVSSCAGAPGAQPEERARPARDAQTSPGHTPTRSDASGSTRLVVWLTIDQLRGDSLSRFAHLVSQHGFGRLLLQGLHFTQASYSHAITETAPGHATLFTGAAPRDHGIVANEWISPSGQLITSVTDPSALLVGPELDASETDASLGRSPRNLLLPTLGDALTQQTSGRSKVASVSTKDRGAIIPAGHAGRAFWLGKKGFVTSRYYGSDAPGFLIEHHRSHPLAGYLEGGWPLLLPESAYASKLDRPRIGARVEAFPHRPRAGTSPAAWLRATPAGDVAVVDLAQHLCQAFELGQDEFVDLLAVSLSSNDYVGHAYGPESREAEDTFARLDRLLSRFFAFLDSHVGESHVLYVLSADHGIPESPESQAAAGLPARRLTQTELEEAARRSLREAFGSDRWLVGVAPPGIYLDRSAVRQSGQDLARVRERLASDLSHFPGVYRAYPLGVPNDGSEVGRHVSKATHADRSGDVYVVTSPHVQLSDPDTAAAHGSPWLHDRHVPILLSGRGVPPGTVTRPVDVRALAGTVADLLGLQPPAGAYAGRLLSAKSGVQPVD